MFSKSIGLVKYISKSCVWAVLAFNTVKGNSWAKDFKYINKRLEFCGIATLV